MPTEAKTDYGEAISAHPRGLSLDQIRGDPRLLGGEEYYPEKHGFDINIAGSSAPAPPSYFAPYKIATLPDGPPGEYITDRLGEEAARFIDQHKDKPFFLYLP